MSWESEDWSDREAWTRVVGVERFSLLWAMFFYPLVSSFSRSVRTFGHRWNGTRKINATDIFPSIEVFSLSSSRRVRVVLLFHIYISSGSVNQPLHASPFNFHPSPRTRSLTTLRKSPSHTHTYTHKYVCTYRIDAFDPRIVLHTPPFLLLKIFAIDSKKSFHQELVISRRKRGYTAQRGTAGMCLKVFTKFAKCKARSKPRAYISLEFAQELGRKNLKILSGNFRVELVRIIFKLNDSFCSVISWNFFSNSIF